MLLFLHFLSGFGFSGCLFNEEKGIFPLVLLSK